MSFNLIHLLAAMGAGRTVREGPILGGTAASPIYRNAIHATTPDVAKLQWMFASTGLTGPPTTIYKGKAQYSRTIVGDANQFTTATGWVTPPETFTDTYWIRATYNEGDPVEPAPYSSPLGNWIQMSPGGSNPTWSWLSTGTGRGLTRGSIKVEIADSDVPDQDSNIVATGYYGGVASDEY